MEAQSLVKGIDVSKWQPNIDWEKVRAQEIYFVFIKATQANYADERFEQHWNGAKRAGIARGAYHLLDPGMEGKRQANIFLKTVKLEPGDLPPVLDVEEQAIPALPPEKGVKGSKPAGIKSQRIPNAQIVACAEQWLSIVEAETGRRPILYSSASFLRDRLGGSGGQPPPWSMKYRLWLAQYLSREISESDRPLSPSGWPEWTFWQYTETGKLDGITDGRNTIPVVNLNFFNGTLEELYQLIAEPATQYAQEDAPTVADQESVPVVQTEQETTGQPTAIFSPPIAGYFSDRADQDSPDFLDIEREVANIANVLTFKQVHPPLALGLFGDWGSGKSFFMGKLRKYIAQIAEHYQKEEHTFKVEADWCSRVAQIEFNAWHFSDSNLWASLVTRIYEGLDRELNREKETADELKRRILEAQIQEAKEKSIEAESQLDLAKSRVDAAEENLIEKRKDREGKEDRFASMISSLPELFKGTEHHKPLLDAANSLGVPQAAESFEALEELDEQLQSLSGRLAAVTTSIFHSPFTLLLMAVFVVILPVIFTAAIERWGAWLTEAGKRVAEISTFLLFVIGWLQAQVSRGFGLVGKVESAFKEASSIRQTKIEQDGTVIAAKKALTEARVEEQAARVNLEIAQTEFQRLQNELQELRPERKLQRLIESRSSTGVYAQHLGIISLIRSDFESMSRILSEMVDEKRDFEKAPPIQRIVLYIDDLDRCKPERVVEVLEAIHLLLYFPLFVVVVAVDPRWLRHSLSEHYPATLNENGGHAPVNERAGISLYSTPQDYLEKIFQIPFALRPVEKQGYQSLVTDLLKPLPPRKRETVEAGKPVELKPEEEPLPEASSGPDSGANPDTETDQHEQQADRREAEEEAIQDPAHIAERTAESQGAPFTPIPPHQLAFTKWEQDDIQQLWRMFRTPRTVKRFINIYRLLRAGLASEQAVKNFEGTQKNPGDYQVALLLLALITAFPNEANQLLYRLDAWLDVQEQRKRRRSVAWSEIVEVLKKEPFSSSQEGQAGKVDVQKSEIAGQPPANPDPELLKDRMDGYADAESTWNAMIDCLDQVIQDTAWKKSFSITMLRTWVMRVARFSFSVQPT